MPRKEYKEKKKHAHTHTLTGYEKDREFERNYGKGNNISTSESTLVEI